MEKCNRSISELKYPFIIYLNRLPQNSKYKTPLLSNISPLVYNAPLRVFFSINEANSLELYKKSRILFAVK